MRIQTHGLLALVSTDNRKLFWTTILWAAGLTSVYLQALFTRGYATWTDQAIVVGICFVAGMLIGDAGRGLAGYIAAILATVAMVTVVSSLPITTQYLSTDGVSILQRIFLIAILRETFPFPVILSLAASLIGALVGERYSW